MAVVAVLLIHIDRPAETANSINTATLNRPLARSSTLLAIAVSIFWACRAEARAKPPKKIKIIGLAKLASALVVSSTPRATAITGTSRAVMLTSKASVSQSTATNTNMLRPSTTAGSNGSQSCMAAKSNALAMIMSVELGIDVSLFSFYW